MKKITASSVVSFLLLFVAWTILPLRRNRFALESPNAQLIIAAYGAFILAAFIFSLVLYGKKKRRDILTSIALIVNGVYTAGVVGMVCMSLPGWFK